MEWLRKLISRKKDPKAVREAGVRALRKRVSQLEAELHSRGREIERLQREATRERLQWEEQTEKLQATIRVRQKDVENMASVVERYRAMVESMTQIDMAKGEAAAAMAQRPGNMGGYQ